MCIRETKRTVIANNTATNIEYMILF